MARRLKASLPVNKSGRTPGFPKFPVEHWQHLRTVNPFDFTFATMRHQTKRSKSCLSRKTALPTAFKLIMAAKKRSRATDTKHLLLKSETGVTFAVGLESEVSSAA